MGFLRHFYPEYNIFYDVKEALSWLEFDGQEVDKLTKWMNRRRL
jgi:hypothetical protein